MQPVQTRSIIKDNIVFQNAAETTGNGTSFEVGPYTSLRIKITGTSTSRTITFYEKDVDGNLTAISGVRASDFTVGTSTTGTAESWLFDVSCAYKIVMDLTAVAGGNVTIKGRAKT